MLRHYRRLDLVLVFFGLFQFFGVYPEDVYLFAAAEGVGEEADEVGVGAALAEHVEHGFVDVVVAVLGPFFFEVVDEEVELVFAYLAHLGVEQDHGGCRLSRVMKTSNRSSLMVSSSTDYKKSPRANLGAHATGRCPPAWP